MFHISAEFSKFCIKVYIIIAIDISKRFQQIEYDCVGISFLNHLKQIITGKNHMITQTA